MPDGWKPLAPLRSARVADKERVRLDPATTHCASRFLYLPHDFVEDRPCYWRFSTSDPANVELSTFKIDETGHSSEQRIEIPHWIRDDQHLASLGDNALPDAIALNAIGWALSFAQRTDEPRWFEVAGVDVEAAKIYLLAAADKGFWPAWNNLGVIARDGFGTEPDPTQAFQYFGLAAESLDPIPLRHLARCYREGLGVSTDESQAGFLDELATSQEEEAKATAIQLPSQNENC